MDSNGHDYQWVQWLHKTFSNPSWIPYLLAWKVSQDDDIVIAGKDEMEHDRNFLAFMDKCMENNLTLNSEKIQFKQPQVSFYGHCWSKHRISPDPKKIQALKHIEFPPDKETMRPFLGMINYLNRYSALCTSCSTPQHTHTSGYRLQTREGTS